MPGDDAVPTPRLADGRPRDAELLEAMVEASEDRLMIVSADGLVLDLNFGSVFGKEIIGRHVKELQQAGYFDRSVALEVIRKKASVTMVQTARNGTKLLVTGKPVFGDHGALRFVVLTARDITELNRALSALEESRKLSERYRTELRLLEMRDLEARNIVMRSPQMRAVYELAMRSAPVDLPVLLLGETGTGKGLFAKLIHQHSARSAGPFLEVNCGAIPDGLMEAELFGYARGAFTGADPRGKVGLIELAHGGTLLLNEIGDLPPPLQVKLLRFLEDGEIQPVGAVKPRRPDVRIIAATNRNLGEMIGHGRFRRDLFYRLNVLTIQIPPLREHRDDIPWLIDMMLAQLESKLQRQPRISAAALNMIARYGFPGNVRELWNLIERLAVLTGADVIDVSHLPPEVSAGHHTASALGARRDGTFRQAMRDAEAAIMREAVERFGSQTQAARHLGLGQGTISRKLKKLGLR
jgi:transcriptional regulator with PAS, ATPase and Fis domain